MRSMHMPLAAALLVLLVTGRAVAGEQPHLIPKVESISAGTGAFRLTRSTELVVLSPVQAAENIPFPIDEFARQLRRVTGFPLPVRTVAGAQALSSAQRKGVLLFEYAAESDLGQEGYALEVTPAGVHVKAAADGGHLYAVQTLLQLLPEAAYGSGQARTARWAIPAVNIMDRPRFSWRGLHLDVSRHFFPASFVKQVIDLLAMHKMNVFHWHLTDDQGWRMEIKKYPRLTEIGAWRADRKGIPWALRKPQQPGERTTYGGFYTQQEIREIVAYAQQRNVTIVPEIEMPAHTTAALAAYPQYSCFGGPFTVTAGPLWPITDIFCAGNDSTFAFLEDVLTEVFDLFPGTFIHVGGDEADKANWKKCPKCQARIKAEGLKNEEELQSYFIRRIAKFIASKGRRPIGWDEILEGGLAPEAAVMSWRGVEGGLAAARMGHDVVMTPGSFTYFNSYQGRPEFEPPAGGGYLPLRTVYAFEPVPEALSPEQARHVIGGQACLWTEFVEDPARAEYMLLPRLAAMAEVLWTPAALRNPDDFFGRIETQLARYRQRGSAYATSLYSVSMTSVLDTARRQLQVALFNESARTPIRYSLNGTDPTGASRLYTGPFTATKSMEIRAVSVRNGKLVSAPTRHTVTIHKAVARPVTLKHPYGRYTGGGPYGLVNGMIGSISYDDGNWQGFEGDDLDATIDLGSIMPVKRLAVQFLQDHHAWIFLPTMVQYDASDDGQDWRPLVSFEVPVPGEAAAPAIVQIPQQVDIQARYIRLHARNLGVCPDWHAGRGGKAWLFADEIIVE